MRQLQLLFISSVLMMSGGAALAVQDQNFEMLEPETTTLSVPHGIILPFDPVVRNDDGAPTGVRRSIPNGWQLCNGFNGTPNLVGRFLKGAGSIAEAGKTGGRSDIPSGGNHAHGRQQINSAGFGDDNSDNQFRTAPAGAHNHGGVNEPEYYALLFICGSSS